MDATGLLDEIGPGTGMPDGVEAEIAGRGVGSTDRQALVAVRPFTGELAWPTLAVFAVMLAVFAANWTAVATGALPIWAGALVTWVAAYFIFTPLHDAVHGAIAGARGPRWLDPLVGHIAGALIWMPFSGYKASHLVHHAHTNHPTFDPDYWIKGNGPLSIFLRCATIIPVFFWHTYRNRRTHPHVLRELRLGTLQMLVQLGIVAWIGWPAVVVWLLPAVLAQSTLAFFFGYLPHHPHADTHRWRNTNVYNLPALAPIYMWQNYHLVHHMFPRVPFYRYGAAFRALRPMMEENGSPIRIG